MSTDASIRLYNGRGHYNEWAFIYAAQAQQPTGPDFEIGNVQTMGLKLVTALIGQLKGTLDVETGTVTVFKITFPNLVLSEINRE